MSNPLVSVIIPTYKRSDYLIRAIESVLKQTYSPIEIIVVDDNDGNNEFRKDTKKSLEKYISKDVVRYVEHEKNKGIAAARNSGIKVAKGEYIAFLDDDDEFLPQKTALQMSCFQKNESTLGLVYGSYIRFEVDTNSERIIKPKFKGDLKDILGVNHIGPPSMVMCKIEAVSKVVGFDESLVAREDFDFYYRLAKHYTIDYVDEAVMKYYIHPNNISKQHGDKLEYMVVFMDRYRNELKKPSLRWSEVNERLAELYAINGYRTKAVRTFLIAYVNRPKRFSILVKATIALLGSKMYKKIRKV
ncbi:glycosyltransferase [Flavobacterium azooxidireducens]|uniref:Glycosyltransferase n=1 Tax=Flavobacterium azooxidireducens TaxID=1871076 RepID=A0ABY4KHN2_9FLAO|nr:glycosyltransferase family 2 protein [Flavobacterium azooxidireducens]UPQ79288.1 glycosyltransferase [Flavobacterium azooxidireducens]